MMNIQFSQANQPLQVSTSYDKKEPLDCGTYREDEITKTIQIRGNLVETKYIKYLFEMS